MELDTELLEKILHIFVMKEVFLEYGSVVIAAQRSRRTEEDLN